MSMKMKIKKGDKVYILTGKNRGKSGRVLTVMPKDGKVIVEGINQVKKAIKGDQKNPQGGIVEKANSINISNVQVICPDCNKSTKIGFKLQKNGKKERVCKKCGRELKE